MNPAVYRTSHQLIRELLCGVRRDGLQAGPGAAGGIVLASTWPARA